MAIDEALVRRMEFPLLRCYQWGAPEITLGFFTPIAQVASLSEPVTRRWTGGGVVEHGDDLTFSLIIPRSFLSRECRAADRYRSIHEALVAALRDTGTDHFAAQPSPPENRSMPGHCFRSPVSWDVIDTRDGAKSVGGAQRLSRTGLLHQGSARLPTSLRRLDHPWIARFASRLIEPGGQINVLDHPDAALLREAIQLRDSRYLSEAWRLRF